MGDEWARLGSDALRADFLLGLDPGFRRERVCGAHASIGGACVGADVLCAACLLGLRLGFCRARVCGVCAPAEYNSRDCRFVSAGKSL